MRIACLQFAPQIGDVDDNLDRADAVLGRVDPEDLDGLDLLVLPELAFTGYNFKSFQQIVPFLEEAGSGITFLWAQTTALKHDCAVVVGYPEKVDVSDRSPASPEYYNSAVMVDGDGDMVVNYRKSFLYYTDEAWALEGGNGFFDGEVPGLGNVALGICTDLNPYKLEARWDAFEFGFHIIKAQANLVIMSMAWQTHHDRSHFNLDQTEPDLETLVYWVQRLEPLIRADTEEEVIVVFCNRTGIEEEATYTGTSAVIGIKRGEVFVYGVLGRGVDDLLIVDTTQPPMSKLTEADAAGNEEASAEKTVPEAENEGNLPELRNPGTHQPEESEVLPRYRADSGLESPRQPTSPRLPWLAQPTQPGETPTDTRSPTRLQIPITTRPQMDEYTAIESAFLSDDGDDVVIDTPALPDNPAFARRLHRPRLATPASQRSPYPWHHHHEGSHSSSVFGAGAAMTPITPFDEGGWSSTPIDQKAPPQWFWRHEPTLSALRESVVEEEEEEEKEEDEEEEQEKEGDEIQKETAPEPRQEAFSLPLTREEHKDTPTTRPRDASQYGTRTQHPESGNRVTEEKTPQEEERNPKGKRTALTSNNWAADLAGVLEEERKEEPSKGVSLPNLALPKVTQNHQHNDNDNDDDDDGKRASRKSLLSIDAAAAVAAATPTATIKEGGGESGHLENPVTTPSLCSAASATSATTFGSDGGGGPAEPREPMVTVLVRDGGSSHGSPTDLIGPVPRGEKEFAAGDADGWLKRGLTTVKSS
ncbi:carbon-nitrogen hydrolase [Corynascus novoguineensis]|uniref:Carbon-nitrogen hydrolase n=1 Tax=Corynascus novoguineensis TaxID=1126955 RepID=A0AAN7HM63_9PEZI|nr:carbon-nitrogen hydrolase [Corynascus novoguineensis]